MASLAPAPLAADTALAVPGITPIVVPNDDFYRIDTALIVPRVNVATWSVTVKGMVDRVVTLTYEQLAALPIFEQYVTIACVSNEVGGNLVGNALWRGVRLREVLAMAGVHPDASQIVGRSVDGFTVGFPTAWAMDPTREPMIALGMNGEPLPVAHGYPARLIVPGLYGYVSATKWLAEIELTTLDAFDAYWVPLGWSKEAPILTQSRIDVPPTATGSASARSRSPGSPGPWTGVSRRSRSRSTTVPGWRPPCPRRSRRRRGSSGGSAGTPRRATTRSRSGRPTGTAWSRPTRSRRQHRTGRAATTRSGSGRTDGGPWRTDRYLNWNVERNSSNRSRSAFVNGFDET